MLIKDRAQKALLGGHYLYQCTKSEMIYISNAGKTTGAEELKCVQTCRLVIECGLSINPTFLQTEEHIRSG